MFVTTTIEQCSTMVKDLCLKDFRKEEEEQKARKLGWQGCLQTLSDEVLNS